MFGVLVSGRLVQTNFQQVSPTKIVFPLDNATDVHHVAVFMTGMQPLPDVRIDFSPFAPVLSAIHLPFVLARPPFLLLAEYIFLHVDLHYCYRLIS